MSHLGRSLARLALRAYPAAWRRRYGGEIHDLIQESDSSLADAADLARAAVSEQLAGGDPMRVAPAHRHPVPFALAAAAVLAPTLAIVVLSVIGHELGVTAVGTVVDGWLRWVDRVRIVDLALVVAPLIAFVLAVLPLVDLRLERLDAAPAVAVRVRAVTGNMLIAVLALLVGAALVWHIVVESDLRLGA
jgi:hypothetical protein